MRLSGLSSERARALSYRGWPKAEKKLGKRNALIPQKWEAHSKPESTGSGQGRRPREHCNIWQEEGSGQQCLHSNHSSFLRQAPSQGPLSPVEVCDSQGSSRRGIPLYPTGEGRHLPPSPYTSSCHVLGHQCSKIHWFLAGCLLKNQNHQVLSSFPQF